MKVSPALGWFTAALILSALPACQKKPIACPAADPAAQPATPKIVSAEPNSFEAVAKHLDSGGGMYVYLSTEGAIKAGAKAWDDLSGKFLALAQKAPAERAKVQDGFNTMAKLFGKSGLSEISGFGISSIALEPGCYQTKWMLHHYKDKADGLIWKLPAGPATAQEIISYLPTNTALASSGNFKLDPIWNALNQEAATNAELRAGLAQVLAQFKQSAGLDLPALLASLGPNCSIILTLDETRKTTLPAGPNGQPLVIPEPALAIMIQLQDDLLINRIDQEISKVPIFTKSTLQDLTLCQTAIPMPMPFLRPFLAWKKGMLILGSNDQLLKEMLDVKAGKKPGLATTAGFKKIMAGMPASGVSYSYMSSSVEKTIRQVQMASFQNNKAMDAEMIQLMNYVYTAAEKGTSCAVMEITPEGWVGTSHSGAGHTQVVAACAVAPAAVLAAVAVPNFIRARSRSQAVACKQDLRMLDAAIEQYALDNNKKSTDPVTFEDLKVYLKSTSPLYLSGGKDTLGNPIQLTTVGAGVKAPPATKTAVRGVVDDAFWSPY